MSDYRNPVMDYITRLFLLICELIVLSVPLILQGAVGILALTFWIILDRYMIRVWTVPFAGAFIASMMVMMIAVSPFGYLLYRFTEWYHRKCKLPYLK